MKRITLIIGLLVLTQCAVSADSLWSDQKGSMFRDLRACKVGDTITIVVTEATTSTQQATTANKKASTIDQGGTAAGLLRMLPKLGYAGTSTSTGDGTTSRTSSFTTTITATVRELLPNGNMVVSAERSLVTNQEKQKVVLTGVVRPADVSPSNTVLSAQVADAKIEVTGKGPVSAQQKEGIASKIIHLLF